MESHSSHLQCDGSIPSHPRGTSTGSLFSHHGPKPSPKAAATTTMLLTHSQCFLATSVPGPMQEEAVPALSDEAWEARMAMPCTKCHEWHLHRGFGSAMKKLEAKKTS